jgi:PAS domain S-box-containing protein
MTGEPSRGNDLARILVQSSIDGLFAIDREVRYTLWNSAMERFAGKTAEQVLGQSVFEVFPFLRDLGLDLAIERAFAGEAVFLEAVPNELPDGSLHYFDRHYLPLRNDGGDVVGMVGVVRDATDRRNAQEALHARDDQLRRAQKLEAVGQLTAGIAHNFNNLLMALIPNLELAIQAAPPELASLLESAGDAAARAAELVRQLMVFTGQNRPAARSVTSIAALVERTVAFCATTFDRRISVEGVYDAAAHANIDATELEQAVANLVINARDALSDAALHGPCLRIQVDVVTHGAAVLAGHDGDFVRLTVRDNGVGMTPETVARVFEPFFTTKEVGKGTGLGLATTHAVVREHGGFITCESAPGGGTTFEVYLPRAMEAEQKAPAGARPMPAGGSETILVVDDEGPIRKVVGHILRSAGYEPLAAASGEEAITLLSNASVAPRVALVLLDESMPGIYGQELRRRLRALAPAARIVVFTGYAGDAIGDGSAGDAPDAVLEKPAAADRILSTIREVIDRRPATPG